MASALLGVVAGMLVVGSVLGAVPDAAAEPESPAARCADLAGHLQIEPALQPLVIEMCRGSATFRRQVARLADAEGLTVTVRQVVFPSTSAWRAQAAIRRVGSEVQSVDVQVHAGARRLVAGADRARVRAHPRAARRRRPEGVGRPQRGPARRSDQGQPDRNGTGASRRTPRRQRVHVRERRHRGLEGAVMRLAGAGRGLRAVDAPARDAVPRRAARGRPAAAQGRAGCRHGGRERGGRLVAFVSLARLTAADDNTVEDIYVLDRATAAISLESATVRARRREDSSQHPRLSGDGRYSCSRPWRQPWRDRASRQPERRWCAAIGHRSVGARVPHAGRQHRATAWSGVPDVSDDGRFVVFESRATDLVAGPDRNHGGSDIYLFDAADGGLRRGASPPSASSGRGPERHARDQRHRAVRRLLVDGPARHAARSDRRAAGPSGRLRARRRDGVARRVSASRRTRAALTATAITPRSAPTVIASPSCRPQPTSDADARGVRKSRLSGAARIAAAHPAQPQRRGAPPTATAGIPRSARMVVTCCSARRRRTCTCRDRCGAAEDLNLRRDVYRVEPDRGRGCASAGP